MLLPEHPVIAVVGAGAVGGYYGGRLAQHGHDAHFLFRSDYGLMKKNGLVVKSCDGDFAIPPGKLRAYDDPAKMPKADLVLVTLKTTANHQFAPLIGPLLKEGTAIMTLQNGLGNEEKLAALFGAGRIVGGVAFVCINRLEDGVIHHSDHGLVQIGEHGGGDSQRARQIARWLSDSQIRCKVIESLKYGRWEKLVWNIPFNGLGAALDLTTDKLIGNEAGLYLVRALMNETIAAAKGYGIAFPEDIAEAKIKHTQTMGAYTSSMQQDRIRGRAMEVEAILGEPLRAAAACGVSAPYMKNLYEIVKAVDAGITRK